MVRLLVSLFFIVIFLNSCEDDISSVNIVNFQDELGISLSQNVNEDGPFPELLISTLDSINCKNSHLNVEKSDYADRTEIKVEGIVLPAQCINGKVKLNQPINIESRDKDRKLNITLKNSLLSKGNLKDNGLNYSIDFVNLLGFKINTTLINKIKPNTCWGVFSSNNIEDIEKFKKLLDSHKNVNFKPEIGNYGLFKYLGNDDVDFSESEFLETNNSSFKVHFYIEYKYWEDFTSEVKKLKEQNPQNSIYLRNFKNKTLSI